ncbi:hypothetical protein GCM10011575_29760 [Microlunatus endophyticus]|uniref:Uncharacterized protein n=1 Tax=Microlunatus endophyticus TaxID=1716077 RepID=A0A917W6Q8_9ACTN|nr:hypothetical protein [Microlunatus endophyticus]GGL69144.1 hypothetical protein GCM10011575_29760 [Microlunatus endophyticus]
MNLIRRPERGTLAAAYAGLALTIAAIGLLYLDHATTNVLASHIRDGYPDYPSARITTAATTYLVYLSILGGLGILTWLATIWAVVRRRRLARWLTPALVLTGIGIGLFNLLIRDTSGDTGLPALIGWVGLVPSLAGLAVVILLWRRPNTTKGIRS